MKSSLPTVTVILYKSKTLANGEHPIMLRLCYNGQRKYKSFGLSCSEKMWNEKKEEVRSTHPYAKSMNTLIRAEVDKANKRIMELERDKKDYSVTTLMKDLSKSAPTTTSLFDMFEERISFFKSTHSHNTATGYRTLLNAIKRYTEETDYELFEVDTEWIRAFEVWLRDNYKDTSIKKFFDCFKAVMNRAVELGHIKVSPFDDYKLIRPLDTKTQKRALSVDEMMTLMRYYMKTYGYGNKPKPNLEKTKVRYWNVAFFQRIVARLLPAGNEVVTLLHHFQESGDLMRVILEVGVHSENVFAGNSLEARGQGFRFAEIAPEAYAVNSAVGVGQVFNYFPTGVFAAVVDEKDLVVQSGLSHHFRDLGVKLPKVALFIEDGNDEGNIHIFLPLY